MFSVTSLGFLPFMALFVCLWYRVPQPSRWKLVLAANAVFCLSIDIGAFFAVALATAVVWQAAQHAQPEQPSRRGWLALGLAAALLPLLVLKYSGMLVPGLRDLYKPFGLAVLQLAAGGLPAGCVAWPHSTHAQLCTAVVLCGLFPLAHPGAVQPL